MRLRLNYEDPGREYRSLLLHPLALLGIWLGVGCLFGLQEFAEMHSAQSHMTLRTSLVLWTTYTATSAGVFIVMWMWLRDRILTGDWRYLVKYILPLSFVASVAQEMLYVLIYPLFVKPLVHRTYWDRLEHVLSGEFISNMAFFWVAIFITRGIGFYESNRRREITTSRLETELVTAQLRALRMQLNPHFLFNAMNGVSSLMHVDTDAADLMLEQLGRMLRLTLERGDVLEVTLREEIEFVQLYLEIQRARFGDRVRYEIDVAPQSLDALIPSMILQPVVENAYQHGIAVNGDSGLIGIRVELDSETLSMVVTNTGDGLKREAGSRSGIGVANVRSRLHLHYKGNQSFTLRESSPGITEAKMVLPLRMMKPEVAL